MSTREQRIRLEECFCFFGSSRISAVLYLACYPLLIFIPLGMYVSNEVFFFTKNSLLSPCHGATVHGTRRWIEPCEKGC